MKKLFATIAVAFVLPAHAGQIEEMPYVKAWAYAQAIEAYCFGGRPDPRLANAAGEQAELAKDAGILDTFDSVDIVGSHKAAHEHLKGDQSACQPAIAFVGRAIAALPDAELDQLTAERNNREQEVRDSFNGVY